MKIEQLVNIILVIATLFLLKIYLHSKSFYYIESRVGVTAERVTDSQRKLSYYYTLNVKRRVTAAFWMHLNILAALSHRSGSVTSAHSFAMSRIICTLAKS